jgi:hypothetical protein
MKTKPSLFFIAMLVAIGVGGGSASAQYGSGQQQQKPSQQPSSSQTGKGAGTKPGDVLTGGIIVATPVTEEEAKKKYPMPAGKSYPMGQWDVHHPQSWISSPYTQQVYDCSKIPQGGLVLDTKVNKVFVRPKVR